MFDRDNHGVHESSLTLHDADTIRPDDEDNIEVNNKESSPFRPTRLEIKVPNNLGDIRSPIGSITEQSPSPLSVLRSPSILLSARLDSETPRQVLRA